MFWKNLRNVKLLDKDSMIHCIVNNWLSISSSQLGKVGPILFICFTSTLSMPAAFLFLGAAIPFLYSSSEKVCTSITSPAASVCSTEFVDLLDMVP